MNTAPRYISFGRNSRQESVTHADKTALVTAELRICLQFVVDGLYFGPHVQDEDDVAYRTVSRPSVQLNDPLSESVSEMSKGPI